jgi:tRNA uridine 5-carbamoylmethylation protein Kti12
VNLTRVVVVGTSCSGKTTLARRLARILATEHVELDSLYWGPEGFIWRVSQPAPYRTTADYLRSCQRLLHPGRA